MNESSVFNPRDSSPSTPSWAAWPTVPNALVVGDEGINAFSRAKQHDIEILTPPGSDKDSVSSEEGHTLDHNVPHVAAVVSVSTTFHAAANLLSAPPDLTLISFDGILFFIHIAQMLKVSSNHFNDIISPEPSRYDHVNGAACVSDTAVVLNVVLHAAYNRSCAHYNPSLDTLVAAVDAMPSYGMSPKVHIAPLFDLILNQAPMQPLNAYALAARHDLFELAKPLSSNLLSLPLDAFTDELARTIDARYLSQLFLLHIRLLDTLKELLRQPPQLHARTPECDFAEQKKLSKAWVMAAAYLAWDARADISPSVIEGALSSLAKYLGCGLCRKGLAARIKDLLAQWSMVKRTI